MEAVRWDLRILGSRNSINKLPIVEGEKITHIYTQLALKTKTT